VADGSGMLSPMTHNPLDDLAAKKGLQKIDLQHLLSDSWQPRPSAILLQCYRLMRAGREEFGGDPFVWEIDRVRALVLWGVPTFKSFDTSFEVLPDQNVRFALKGSDLTAAPEGRYVLLTTPMDLENDESARLQLREALGLMYTFHGRNIAYNQLFEHAIKLTEPGHRYFSDVIENPFHLPAPGLDDRSKRIFQALARTLAEAPSETKRRLGLALRWFESAAREVKGVDALLRYWVAIEAVALPEGTNVRFANERLARAYGISRDEAAKEFEMGRLQGLRSKIVHGNLIPAIHGDLLSYLSALFCDLVFLELGLPSPKRSRQFLSAKGETVREALRSAMGAA
jgi:hypothetical protein